MPEASEIDIKLLNIEPEKNPLIDDRQSLGKISLHRLLESNRLEKFLTEKKLRNFWAVVIFKFKIKKYTTAFFYAFALCVCIFIYFCRLLETR